MKKVQLFTLMFYFFLLTVLKIPAQTGNENIPAPSLIININVNPQAIKNASENEAFFEKTANSDQITVLVWV